MDEAKQDFFLPESFFSETSKTVSTFTAPNEGGQLQVHVTRYTVGGLLGVCVVLYRRRREPLTTAIQPYSPMPRSSKPQADSHQHGRQLAALSSVSGPGAVIISAHHALLLVCKLHGGRFNLPRLPPLTFQLYSIKIIHGCPYHDPSTLGFLITPLSIMLYMHMRYTSMIVVGRYIALSACSNGTDVHSLEFRNKPHPSIQLSLPVQSPSPLKKFST